MPTTVSIKQFLFLTEFSPREVAMWGASLPWAWWASLLWLRDFKISGPPQCSETCPESHATAGYCWCSSESQRTGMWSWWIWLTDGLMLSLSSMRVVRSGTLLRYCFYQYEGNPEHKVSSGPLKAPFILQLLKPENWDPFSNSAPTLSLDVQHQMSAMRYFCS